MPCFTAKTLPAALALILAGPAALSAHAGTVDDAALNREVGKFRSLATRGAWVNPWLTITPEPAGDARLQAQVAGYTRSTLDRGGWHNPWVSGDHYTADHPLLAARIGGGVTTRDVQAATHTLAARISAHQQAQQAGPGLAHGLPVATALRADIDAKSSPQAPAELGDPRLAAAGPAVR